MIQNLSLIVLPLLMMLAAATDIASMRIPNWLTGLVALAFFPMAYATGMTLELLVSHLTAGVLLFFVGFALFAFRLFGGGDAKLMAAAGLWFGKTDVMQFLVATAIAGGVLSVLYVIWTVVSHSRQPAVAGQGLRQMLRAASPKLPYGCALAVGAILAFPASWWAETAARAAVAAA
jgi:prepilin peptidase CpaA